jgi:hypothetical protein
VLILPIGGASQGVKVKPDITSVIYPYQSKSYQKPVFIVKGANCSYLNEVLCFIGVKGQAPFISSFDIQCKSGEEIDKTIIDPK